jgi:hypothetical protein
MYESGAASLSEGFEQTLTVHQLGVTGTLRKTLQTTNPIESAFDTLGRFCWPILGTREALEWRSNGHALGRLWTHPS